MILSFPVRSITAPGVGLGAKVDGWLFFVRLFPFSIPSRLIPALSLVPRSFEYSRTGTIFTPSPEAMEDRFLPHPPQPPRWETRRHRRRPHLRRLPHLPSAPPRPRRRRTLHPRRPLPLHARRRPRPHHRTLPPLLSPRPPRRQTQKRQKTCRQKTKDKIKPVQVQLWSVALRASKPVIRAKPISSSVFCLNIFCLRPNHPLLRPLLQQNPRPKLPHPRPHHPPA